MPLYYVDRFDGVAVIDDVGVDLHDPNAMRGYVRDALTEMMAVEPCAGQVSRCQAFVRDASGRRVLEASLVLTISPEPQPACP